MKIKCMIKKITSLFTIMLFSIAYMSGCTDIADMPGKEGKLSIVCTTFPQYDWVKNIIKGKEDIFDVTLIMDNGADLHNYQPTTEDMVIIGASDIFIYVGGESDAWVDDALKETSNKNIVVINLMDVLGENVYEEEIIEGMTAENHNHTDDEHEDEYDEHIWLSLKNAKILVQSIAAQISVIDKENAGIYEDNLTAYIASLDELDEEYRDAVSNAERNTILFGDRFAFRYMIEDYDIDYYAAFNGCSAETEASFETITYLSGKLDELGLPVVFVLENADTAVAQAVIDNTRNKNQTIMTLNSMQSVTTDDINAGVTYIDVMKDNLSALRQALY